MEKNSSDHSHLWTYFALVPLGFWLFVSPATFGFTNRPFMISNWICGALLILLGLNARRNFELASRWAMAFVGIWLEFSPLVFWVDDPASYLNDTFIGAWVICLALILYPLPGALPDKGPYMPPGWSFNPSGWPPRQIIALIAFSCWMISRYLAAYQLGFIYDVWDPFFHPGTKAVIESKIASLFPVSDAGLGAFVYTIEFFSACLGGKNRWRTAPWAVLIFGFLVIPAALVSIVLIILQPLAVGNWCTLCLTTATLMLIGIPFAVPEVTATLQFLKYSKEKPFWTLLFKGGECPKGSEFEHVPLNASLFQLWRSARSGITCPWNLLVSALLGICLMASPALFHLVGVPFDSDPIAGALAVVVSVISMSEAIRKIRWINALLGAWILVSLFWLHAAAVAHIWHAVIGVLLILFCIRKGPVRDKTRWA